MAVEMDDFIWYAPRNHFYYLPTGDRWAKKGVEARIGTAAVKAVIEKRAIIDKEELTRLLRTKGDVPYDSSDDGVTRRGPA
jgi:hypothetical protein